MDSATDKRLAEIAVREGYLSIDQVEDCRRRQEDPKDGDYQKPLYELFLQSNLLTPQKLQRLLEIYQTETSLVMPGTRAQESSDEAGSEAAPPETFSPRKNKTAESLRPTRSSLHSQGERFGKYKLLREIGRGAMGVVWLALDEHLNRQVALKMLRDTEAAEPETVRRFLREAKTAARLNHEAIVTIHEVGTVAGTHYFTMEYIEGETLEGRLKSEQISRDEALRIVERAARAIQYAHVEGVVHRDLKPGNILVDVHGLPHVSDFGLARWEGASTAMTEEGTAVGTPHYMAPEQVRGELESLDARTDVFALGVMVYRILTGSLPFEGRSVMEVYQKILNYEPRRPRQIDSSIPPELETVCSRAMAKDRTLRYESAAQFAEDLVRYLGGRPITAKPISVFARLGLRARRNKMLVTVGLVAVAAMVAGGVLLTEKIRADMRARSEIEARERREKAEVPLREARAVWERLWKGTERSESVDSLLKGVREGAQKAAVADPGWAEAHALAARSAEAAGSMEEAVEAWDRAVAADPLLRVERVRCRLVRLSLLQGTPVFLAGPGGWTLSASGRGSDPRVKGEADRLRSDVEGLLKQNGASEGVRLASESVLALLGGDFENAAIYAGRVQGQGAEIEIAQLAGGLASFQRGALGDAYRQFLAFRSRRLPLAGTESVAGLALFRCSEVRWALDQMGPDEASVLRGLLWEVLNETEKAEQEYTKGAGRGAEEGADALAKRALLRLESQRWREAGEDVAGALAKSSEFPDALLARAALALETGRPAEALQDAENVLKRRPDDVGAVTARLRAQAMLGTLDRTRILTESEKLVKLLPSHATHALAAEILLQRRSFLSAQENAQASLRIRPGYVPALLTLARAYMARREYADAETCYTRVIEGGRTDPDLFFERASCHEKLGELRKALADCESALQKDPLHRLSLVGHAEILYRLGERERALQELEEFPAKVGGEAREYVRRAESHRRIREFDRAIADYRRAIELGAVDAPVLEQAIRAVKREAGTLEPPTGWRECFQRANQEISLSGSNNPELRKLHYPLAREWFLKGIPFLPDLSRISRGEREEIANGFYNLACTFGAEMEWTTDADDRVQLREKTLLWLDKSIEVGFLRIRCPCHPDGRKHAEADVDFSSLWKDERFRSILQRDE